MNVITTKRAAPMSAEDRKAAIVAVVIPLIAERGASVTTAEIAAAAGVAEGTLYRVFPDKVTLLVEAVKSAIDPSEVTVGIDAIDPSLPLATKLETASQLLLARVTKVTSLVNAMRSIPHPEHDHDKAQRFVADSEATITASLTAMLLPHAHELRVEPVQAAMALRGLLLAAAHPLLAQGNILSVEDAIAILTSGIVAKDAG